MRSISTSFVAVLPVASLLFVGAGLFGAVALRDFALALFVGLLTGAYSSIFVATPLLAWWKEREPRYRSLRDRSAAQMARGETAVREATAEPEPEAEAEPEPTPEPAGASVPASAPARPSPPRPAAAPSPSTRTPRPRQQRRRKRR
jgi:preprotein translocase subunit SecF